MQSNDIKHFIKCDVFTPDTISKIMASKLGNQGSLLEPSVGTGKLLTYLDINHYDKVDLYELKKEYIDTLHDNITRITSTTTNTTNNTNTNSVVNIYNVDFLKATIEKKYDNIIMNPPYIKTQDLSEEYRAFLKKQFPILATGLVDIYYAFILKCIDLLEEHGRLVCITPNSFLYNKSAYKLRKYLFDHHYIREIIDFKEEKIFKNTHVYCCITIIEKNITEDILLYNGTSISYDNIKKNYSLFDFETKTENVLGNICSIKNGIATLRDKIYIHSEQLFDEPCWEEITNGVKNEFIIYPYKNGKIIKEDAFKEANPLTYAYLKEHKSELAKRDKGKKTYPAWYAYGRSQSVAYNTNTSIYIPVFIHPNNIKDYLYTRKGMLHKSCLCIQPTTSTHSHTCTTKIIKAIEKNIDFIINNSAKRSGGWISLSTRILKQIPL